MGAGPRPDKVPFPPSSVRVGPAPYGELQPYVSVLVRRVLGSDDEHGDVVQEVFYRVLRYQEHLYEPAGLKAWVRTITLNVVADLWRRRRGTPIVDVDVDAAAEPRGDLVRTVEVRDLLSRLKSRIERLPPQEQSAFTLRFVEGRTLDEIAALEGYSVATARRRLARPGRILKAFVSKDWPALASRMRQAVSPGDPAGFPGHGAEPMLGRS